MGMQYLPLQNSCAIILIAVFSIAISSFAKLIFNKFDRNIFFRKKNSIKKSFPKFIRKNLLANFSLTKLVCKNLIAISSFAKFDCNDCNIFLTKNQLQNLLQYPFGSQDCLVPYSFIKKLVSKPSFEKNDRKIFFATFVCNIFCNNFDRKINFRKIRLQRNLIAITFFRKVRSL